MAQRELRISPFPLLAGGGSGIPKWSTCLVALRLLYWLLLTSLGVHSALAQWADQSVTLRPGWNSVFLELQPEPSACSTAFAGLPVESVWAWNKRFSSVQYIQDPADLIAGQPDWLYWVATAVSSAPVSLINLQGNQAYLIKVATNVSSFVWTVHGRPSIRSADWVPNSFNLVGLYVDPLSPPTFQSCFAPSPAHAGLPIYRLNLSGAWTMVANPSVEHPNSGEAYWVRCSGPSTYSGPLGVTVPQGGALDYGRTLVEQTVSIRNASTNTRLVSVRHLASAPPPGTNFPGLAGPVPLSQWIMNYPSNIGFFPVSAPITNPIPPGGEWPLRLAVRRTDMSPYAPPIITSNALYQSILEVADADGGGVRKLVPMSGQPMDVSGLWVGTATITNVSEVRTNVSNTPTPTASPFQFRLLVHQGADGQARLLQQVLVAWKNGTTNQPGGYVLATHPPTNGSYDKVVRRFSSAAFGFIDPILMSPTNESFGAVGSNLTCTVASLYNDPRNPFVHRYHPDHDNLNDSYTNLTVLNNVGWPAIAVPGPRTSESFTVTRYLTLEFTAADPEHLTLAGWGDSRVGGLYKETITGLNKNPIYIEGIFRLHHAVTTGVLNNGIP